MRFTPAPRKRTSPRTPNSTTPYFTDNYWKHPENQAIQIFDPSVPFGVPFAPTPFRVTFHIKAGDVEVTKELPVEYRYVKDIYFGDKRMELNVVPAFSVRVTPALAVIPAPAGPASKPAIEREIHVTVTNGTKGAAQANVALEAARRLEGHSRQRAAQLRARGRIALGPLPGHRSGAGQGRRVHSARGSDFARDRRHEVRQRIPGDRVSAHSAAAGDRAGRGRAQGG